MTEKVLKYQEIADWLKENIESGTFKPGDKLISEPNICKKFGVSRQTARSALVILEKEGYISRKQGSGTYVNHFINGKRRKKIGMLFTYAEDYIFPAIISGIEEVLTEQGHTATLDFTHNKVEFERRKLLSLIHENVDGLIVEAAKAALPSPNLDIYKEFAVRGIPIIFINTYHDSLNCNYVINNDIAGGRLATRHLIDNGHTKIGGIFKHDDVQGNYRYKGFIKEVYEQDMHLNEDAIIWYSTETLDSLFYPEQFGLLMNRLAYSSGVICYNDQVAVKLINACTQIGVNVPQDLSVVSFDNSNLCERTTVSLSSITHPSTDMGRLAAESLFKIIDGSRHKVQHVFEPQLVVRSSVLNLT